MRRPARTTAVLLGAALVLPLAGSALTADAASPDVPLAAQQVVRAADRTISGSTVTPRGGLLDDVTVEARDGSGIVATALTYGGKYELHVPRGSYRVSFRLEGYLSKSRQVVVRTEKHLPAVVMVQHAPEPTREPEVDGEVAVGETLTADHGRWDKKGLRFGQQWLRDGKPVAGERGRSYRVTARDAGHRLAIAVDATSDLAAPASVTSDAETVAKGTVALELEAVAGRRGVQVTVTTDAPSWAEATGTVTVKEGRRTLGTLTLEDGEASGRLPRLAPGRHVLVAHYDGSAAYRPADADPVTVRTR